MDRPIHHIVMWRLNGDTPQARAVQSGQIIAAFEATLPLFPELIRFEIGPNVVPSGDAWDLAVSAVFSSRAALDHYNAHPAHLGIKALVGPMRAARCQIDFELETA